MNKERITWGSRLIIYSYLDTSELLGKVTKLSNRERGFLLNSHIAGNRYLRLKLKGDDKLKTIAMLNKKSVELNMSLFSDITLQVDLNFDSSAESLPRLCRFIGRLPLKFNDRRLSLELNVSKPMKNDTGSFLKADWRRNLIFKRFEFNYHSGNKLRPKIPSYALIQLGQMSESVRLSYCQVVEHSKFAKWAPPANKQPIRSLELRDCEMSDPPTLSKLALQSVSTHRTVSFHLDKWTDCSYIESLDLDQYAFLNLFRK